MKKKLKKILEDNFNIKNDAASNEEIRESIKNSANIKGTNMCILILAIIVASVGLNMNSVAVIIGAMLISPLMGNITAIGYAIATNDIKIAKKYLVGFIFQVIISILVSFIYFKLSPISTTTNELLGRTAPTIWDAIIAISGGFAGIIALTRKEKTNVIPGVAIATALMPPLCTAGYSLAIANFAYFGGALILFLINSLFICITSFIVLYVLNVPIKRGNRKHVQIFQLFLIIVTILVLIPSYYFSYNDIKTTEFQTNLDTYVKNEFKDMEVLKTEVKNKKIKIIILGDQLEEEQINKLESKLSNYKLSNYTLEIAEANLDNGLNEEEIKQMLETYSNEDIESLKNELLTYKTKDYDTKTITIELKSLYKNIEKVSIGIKKEYNVKTKKQTEVADIDIYLTKALNNNQLNQLKNFMSTKITSYKLNIKQHLIK